MKKPWPISRRAALRGMGASVALPLLEAMAPPRSQAVVGDAAAMTGPTRAAFVYVPNGVHMP
ncbi:MAG TPA: hypothetical protein VKE74_02445, partial [Gemmataceae bacterium]|nr:hypothetical protein [Gemmataceae bacterium]